MLLQLCDDGIATVLSQDVRPRPRTHLGSAGERCRDRSEDFPLPEGDDEAAAADA